MAATKGRTTACDWDLSPCCASLECVRLSVSGVKETTMQLNEFFDYLRAHATTRDLGASLADVLALRRRRRIAIPIPVESDRPRQIAG
jgi:hypothetical protein